MTNQERINRIMELGRAIRAKENAAAASGDYLRAIFYNRAYFRATMLAASIHSREYHGYRITAINLNEYYATRMPYHPPADQTRLRVIMSSPNGGQN